MVATPENDQNPGQAVTPPGVDISGIYASHDGPYSLMVTRQVKHDKVMGRQIGPVIARSAHEQALALINDPAGDVVQVYVYSEKEKQFIGATYTRGIDFAPWPPERGPHGYGGGLDATADEPVDGSTLLPRRREKRLPKALRVEPGEVHDPSSTPLGSADLSGVRDGPREKRPRQPRPAGDRFPAVRGRALEVDPGNAEQWPGKGASVIREWFDAEPGRRATVAEIVQAVGAELNAKGVGFPASLVSRLKQAGFLREAQDASNPTD